MTAERPLVPDGSPKHGTEEFRKAKDAINKEGWEDNAAVVIGTKDEVDRRTEQLIEGRETVDLRTYIYRNTVTEVANEELANSEFEKYADAEVYMWKSLPAGSFSYDGLSLLYKSKNGDLKTVTFNKKEISDDGRQQFGKLGFVNVYHRDKMNDLFKTIIIRVKQFREITMKAEAKKGFEF